MKKICFLFAIIFSLSLVFADHLTAQTTTVKRKTNSTHKAKTTAIGAGVGAATGAIVSHKKGKGAIIGGAVGAGAGYMYGRHRDKKHPKVVTKTKKVTQ